MEHLASYPSVQLTEQTITNSRRLVEVLDDHGPHAAQFDLLEYSRTEICVAYSLGLPGQASSIALSMPAHQHPRLIIAARTLSARATGILLAHLIADDRSGHLPLADEVPRQVLVCRSLGPRMVEETPGADEVGQPRPGEFRGKL
ncbi:hypothetical protein ACGFSD_36325 [Streptomyces caniferus]|uniref:hypothetical protein n=1 Tax=Streptomyces caniferus TaxID=285557 RepID=UPI00371D2033